MNGICKHLLGGFIFGIFAIAAGCERNQADSAVAPGSETNPPAASSAPVSPAASSQKSAGLSQAEQEFVRARPGQVVIYIAEDGAEGADSLAHSVGESGRVISVGATRMLTDVADASVDVVFSNSVYHNLVTSKIDRPGWLADVRRVLKPDGTFIIADTGGAQAEATSQKKSGDRFDEQVVIDEVRKAGFDLVEQGRPSEPVTIPY